MDQLELARKIAEEAHNGQYRRDGKTQYIEHPEKVVSLLPDIDGKVVGWLHDVLEDGNVTLQYLQEQGIKSMYVNIIRELTKNEDEVYSVYIMRLKESDHPICVRVKIADIVANLTDQPSRNQTLKYTDALTYLCGDK